MLRGPRVYLSDVTFSATSREEAILIVNEYLKGDVPLYHFDFYRISDPDELYGIGFDDYLDGGICIGEWCENIGDLVPEDAIRIEIVKSGENSRIINTSYDFYTEI